MRKLAIVIGFLWAIVLQLVVSLAALLTLTGVWAYGGVRTVLQNTPELDLARLKLRQSIRIVDRRGGDLYRLYDQEDRSYLPDDEIPDIVRKAFVAIEDERFFTRKSCVDYRAIARALMTRWQTGKVEGASTITQQLVRNVYLSREKTVERKLKEIDLACQLEGITSKEDLLNIYVNQLAFGNNAFGIEQASQTYFGVSATQLTLPQAAVLAAIPQRTSYFNPYGPHERTSIDHQTMRDLRSGKLTVDDIPAESIVPGLLSRAVSTASGSARVAGRGEMVLDAMLRNDFITKPQHTQAVKDLMKVTFQPVTHPISAPYFTLRIRDEMNDLLNTLDQPQRWLSEGITVHTTLDPLLQWMAESVVEEALPKLNESGIHNVALVAIDRSTRQVLAYVGNVGYFESGVETSQIDMAATPRQPGSSFKPIVYSALFEDGYTPESFIQDMPLTIGGNEPKNYDGNFRGWMTIRNALSGSRNIPAINAFVSAGGEERVLDVAERMGVTTPKNFKKSMLVFNPRFTFGWPMAIGAAEVPLIEMVQAYATIAEHGQYRPLQEICGLSGRTNSNTTVIPPGPVSQAIQAATAEGVDSILRDVESKPTGFWRSVLTIPGMDVGAKTGTSNVCFARDGYGRCRQYGVSNIWTIGYNENLVVGVWAGNADGSPLANEMVDGLTDAAPIWREFLLRATPFHSKQDPC